MTILCFAITVVVPVRVLDEKYPGGFAVYDAEAKALGLDVCNDHDLVGVYFRSPRDAQSWIDRLEQHGLVHFEGDVDDPLTVAIDLTVVDMLNGPTLPTPWLVDSFDSSKRQRTAWAKGAEQTDAAIPETFDVRAIEYAVFVPNEDLAKRQTANAPGTSFMLPGHENYPRHPRRSRKWVGIGILALVVAGIVFLLF